MLSIIIKLIKITKTFILYVDYFIVQLDERFTVHKNICKGFSFNYYLVLIIMLFIIIIIYSFIHLLFLQILYSYRFYLFIIHMDNLQFTVVLYNDNSNNIIILNK